MKEKLLITAIVLALLPTSALAVLHSESGSGTGTESEDSTEVGSRNSDDVERGTSTKTRIRFENEGIRVENRMEFKNATSTFRNEIRDERNDLREKASTTTRAEVRANNEARKIELRAEFKKRHEERLKEFVGKVVGHLERAVERLTAIAEKIESRIEKFKEKGIETTGVEAKLVVARGMISLALTSIDAISLVTVSSNDPRGSLETLRVAINEARSAIKAAHSALVDVVNSLKPGQNKIDRESPENENENATSSDEQ